MKILEQKDTERCTKNLKIEIPRDEIGKELDGVYSEFMENMIVPGFRKGKAPRHIVQMRYGTHLKDEAINKAIESAFKDAIKELDLNLVNQADFKEIEKEKEDEPVVFEVEFEYMPVLESVQYKDIQIEAPKIEITEKEIVETLDDMRERNAAFTTIEDRPVAENDYVSISSKATVDGEPFPEATSEEIRIEVGSGHYIAGFEDQLIGLNVNDEKEFSLTIPEDFPIEKYRGKEAHFEIQVKVISEKNLPELDDEFAKDMGDFENLSAPERQH